MRCQARCRDPTLCTAVVFDLSYSSSDGENITLVLTHAHTTSTRDSTSGVTTCPSHGDLCSPQCRPRASSRLRCIESLGALRHMTCDHDHRPCAAMCGPCTRRLTMACGSQLRSVRSRVAPPGCDYPRLSRPAARALSHPPPPTRIPRPAAPPLCAARQLLLPCARPPLIPFS